MLEFVLEIITEVLLCLLSLGVYAALVGIVLPRTLLKLCFIRGASLDRGIKKYKYPDGRAVLYEPHPSVRRYIKLYTLFVNGGTKYLKCMLASDVHEIKYNIVIFDNVGRVVELIKINDAVDKSGQTRSVIMPSYTSYVSIFVREVNGAQLPKQRLFTPDKERSMIFLCSVTLLTLIEALVIRMAALDILENINEDIKVSLAFTIITALLIGVLCAQKAISKRRKMGVM